MPLILGLTNKLPRGLALFMFEFDETPVEDVYEEANFLSQVFDLDIYVLESSKGSYHLISFDLISEETLKSVQAWISLKSNYYTFDESPLFGRSDKYNVLRIGNKATKKPPRFLKLFPSRGRPRLKSLAHYAFYRQLGVPEINKELLVKIDAQISVYNGGIGSKPKPRNKSPFF